VVRDGEVELAASSRATGRNVEALKRDDIYIPVEGDGYMRNELYRRGCC
jgi:hypothetical protein